MADKGIVKRDESQMKHIYHVVEEEQKTKSHLLDKFVDFAVKGGVPRDDKGLAVSANEIRYVIKGLIARNLFTVDAYFQVISGIDNEVQKAIELIHDDSAFKTLAGKK